MPTYSSCFSLNLDISPPYVAWFLYQRLIPCFRLSCSLSTAISTKAVRSIYCSQCFKCPVFHLCLYDTLIYDLQSVLSAQFETATEFGSLLRANTPVSRMMTTYTRRGPGQSYLKSVLAERINSLIEHKDLNLEINPLKVCSYNICRQFAYLLQVYEQMINQIEEETGALPPNLPRGVPPEEAAANTDVQAIIAPRLTMLMEIANSFLATIIDNMEIVPYGIRWICKQIRSLTRVRVLFTPMKSGTPMLVQRKYPEATDYAICSLIGGFFFLRFINPAIVTPQAYMLVQDAPAKHPRRTLTLVCLSVNQSHGACWTSCISRLPRCYKISQISPHMPRSFT
jgi:GTPase-activator protein for Ras-like GTPase